VPVLKQRSPELDKSPTTLCLLRGPFVVKHGERLEIPEGSKRLLVFVALAGGRVNRRHAAGTLWPYGDDQRAAGNLRSALWRLRGAGIDILHSDKCSLYLSPDSTVDIAQLSAWATRIIEGTTECSDLDVANVNLEAVHLLPGWYEDWVVFERERLRQRLLHAMETLARRLIGYHHFAGAVEAAMTAVGIEPLRESAQRVLIEAHLAEGNWVEARRVFATYRDLVNDELGVMPSRALADIFRSVPNAKEAQIEVPLLQKLDLSPDPPISTQAAPTRNRFGTNLSAAP
jgi:DNA-binding SARP family transcriptional activator